MTLSLMQALNEDRLEDFIAQAEAYGVSTISEAEFDETASVVLKTPLQDDQTSCSPHRDGSPER